MNKSISIIVIFLFNSQIVKGQNVDVHNNWDKIIIQDAYLGGAYFYNKFQIKKDDLLLTSFDKQDSIIKKVDPKLIYEIINLLNNNSDSYSSKEPLSFFGKDSLWLKQNAEKLWEEYKKNRKTTKEIDSIAISTIKDTRIANKIALSLQGSKGTDDYPFVFMQLINKNDTLSVASNGQYPYMLPWHINKYKIYNSRLSELIAELLPDKVPSNKERLNGKNFNYHFINEFYREFIKDKENYLQARNKYSRNFKLLEKEFEIKKVEIVDMSSIEWGGDFGRRCLEMSLKDSTVSKNIEFYTIFGTNKFLNSPKTILYKKDKLINLLKLNPIYKYTLNCDNCLGEIHWVNSKSLSKEAEESFKEDLADNGIDKNKYNGRYKDAIFYELTENRDSETSFSRWIFLKDGTLILWEFRGNYLMAFPKDFIVNKGYICKEIVLK
jgi:hypothetical protein